MTIKNNERGLCELYESDPERADYVVFGRRAKSDRRGFLHSAGLVSMSAIVGAAIPFHANMPAGLIPAALAQSTENFKLAGKDGLIVLNDRPINAETPAHLLDDDITPTARHFVRNNGIPPTATAMQADDWTLTIDGEVQQPLNLSLSDLKTNFDTVELALQLECGGNGRAAFIPPARGNQWTFGAIGNAKWTGVRYRDLLQAAGIKQNAIYTAHYGMDKHLSGDPEKSPISRGVPIAKAMEEHSLIAIAMNGQPIPSLHGSPARIICPGWPASTGQKWLRRIQLRKLVHDGAKMNGKSYRVPRYNVAPGTKVPEEDFEIIESMPVKSLISSHATGTTLNHRTIKLAGHAWAGDQSVRSVEVSADFGATWHPTDLEPPPNPYSWQRWRMKFDFPTAGYYELWARATDDHGVAQPFTVNWNPKGYLNNSMHRIGVTVT